MVVEFRHLSVSSLLHEPVTDTVSLIKCIEFVYRVLIMELKYELFAVFFIYDTYIMSGFGTPDENVLDNVHHLPHSWIS
jgi:hypothetical protein